LLLAAGADPRKADFLGNTPHGRPA
jgi:hypothetical protein